MKNTCAVGLVASVVGLLAFSACGDRGDPANPLRDEIRLLGQRSAQRVRELSLALERETSAELGVLIINSVSGNNLHHYSTSIHSRWGLGKPGQDNGVLLLFAIKDRRMSLIAGKRYRSVFPRPVVNSIIGQVVGPRMRAGRRQEAIESCVALVADKIRHHEAKRSSRGTAATPGQQQFGFGPAPGMIDRERIISLSGLGIWMALMTTWFLLMIWLGWRLMPPRLVIYLLSFCGPAWFIVLELEALSAERWEQELPAMVISAAAMVVAVLYVYLAHKMCANCGALTLASKGSPDHQRCGRCGGEGAPRKPPAPTATTR